MQLFWHNYLTDVNNMQGFLKSENDLKNFSSQNDQDGTCFDEKDYRNAFDNHGIIYLYPSGGFASGTIAAGTRNIRRRGNTVRRNRRNCAV